MVDCGQYLVLDETYNASPESVIASLELLVSKPGRHFAVLGTMLELGSESILLHQKVLKKAIELSFSLLRSGAWHALIVKVEERIATP